MPFFMDVHRAGGEVSLEQVASDHLADMDAQDRFGVVYHRYFVNEGSGTVFCLAEAPSADACVAVHQVAHGNTAEEIIEVTPLVLEAFLGGGRTAGDGLALGRDGTPDAAERTVAFTDIVDSTGWGVRLGDRAAFRLVRDHDRIVEKVLSGGAGQVVKGTGDGSLLSFRDPAAAVDAAIAIQGLLQAERAVPGAVDFRVRIGIDLGEPVAAHGDLYGRAVNLARRVCDAAAPDEILATDAVRARLEVGRYEVSSAGERSLKGFDQPVALSRIGWAGSS